MKSKKAVKRLDEVERLLRDVQEKYTGATDQFTKALQALRTSVQNAKELVQPDQEPEQQKQPGTDGAGATSQSTARRNSAMKQKAQPPRAKA